MKQNIFRFLDLAPSGPQLFHLDDAEEKIHQHGLMKSLIN